jgi:RNA polymerase sigma-70 factor (sigma-E family)
VPRPVDSGFDAFAAASMPQLRRLAYAWCRDHHRADDLVQSALERVYAAWPRIERTDDPFSYTRTTMVRLLITEQRRAWWRREVVSDDVPERIADGSDVAQRLDLVALVHRLPRRQRLVVLLRFVEDLSVAQTAAAMSCSEGAVKSQTNAAMTALRQWCAEDACLGAPR